MVVFMEGPADGQRLMLRRIPIMLRVVQNRSGEWDALNELDDGRRWSEREAREWWERWRRRRGNANSALEPLATED